MTCKAELKEDAQHTENINTNICKIIAIKKNQHWPNIKLQSELEDLLIFFLKYIVKRSK